eukprot:10365300-Karenia_brevis.AAC.1
MERDIDEDVDAWETLYDVQHRLKREDKARELFQRRCSTPGQWRYHPDFPEDKDMIQIRCHRSSEMKAHTASERLRTM